jgi:dienelactone hydrolase
MKFKIIIFAIHTLLAGRLFAQDYTIKFFQVSTVKVGYIEPKIKSIGTILVLPGWNFSNTDICEKSDFCENATLKGYKLILPNMLKSVYCSKLFPETRNDWRGFPTLKWLNDTMIPWFQKNKNILNKGGNNFVFGISTGGRGVAMTLIYTDSIFKAGAALSGDYNQLSDTSDNLMNGYYGRFSKFPERWKGSDNPSLNSNKINVPIYLAHGKADNIVNYKQTVDFYNELKKNHPDLKCELHIIDNESHNYKFWKTQYNNVFEFYNKNSK